MRNSVDLREAPGGMARRSARGIGAGEKLAVAAVIVAGLVAGVRGVVPAAGAAPVTSDRLLKAPTSRTTG